MYVTEKGFEAFAKNAKDLISVVQYSFTPTEGTASQKTPVAGSLTKSSHRGTVTVEFDMQPGALGRITKITMGEMNNITNNFDVYFEESVNISTSYTSEIVHQKSTIVVTEGE